MNSNAPHIPPRSLPRLRHTRRVSWQRFVYSQRVRERGILRPLALIALLTLAFWELVTAHSDAVPLPFGALLIALILTILYFALASVLNSTAITADATHVTVDGRPLPMPNRIRVPLNSIAVIDYRTSKCEDGQLLHHVVAVLRNRAEFEVMRTPDADIAQRIALELERHRRAARCATARPDLRSA